MKKLISYILICSLLLCSMTVVLAENVKQIVIDTDVPQFKNLVDDGKYYDSKTIMIADLSPVHYIVMEKESGATAELKVDGEVYKTFDGYRKKKQGNNLDCRDAFETIYTATDAGSYMVYATDIYEHDIAIRFTLSVSGGKNNTGNSSGGSSGGGDGGFGGSIIPQTIKQPYADGNPDNTGGKVKAGEKITLDTDTGNAKIYYTTDGTNPTSKSTLYDEDKGIVLEAGQTLKAVTIKSGVLSKVSEWVCSAEGGSTQKGESIVRDVLETEEHIVYMNGYPDGTFGPDKNMTRAEAATMFARLMKEKMNLNALYNSSFPDVEPDAWYYNYVGYMEKFGIINGYEDGTFRPENTITRAEFVTMASRFAQIDGSNSCSFKDVSDDFWAYEYIAFAAANGWVGGYEDGTFKPEVTITRAEVVTVVNNMLARAADEEYVKANKSSLVSFSDVKESHWAYYRIMEATNEHEYIKDGDREKWN